METKPTEAGQPTPTEVVKHTFKGTDMNLQCRGFQFEIGKTYTWSTHNNMQLARALGCSGTLVKAHRAQQAPDTKTPRGRIAIDLSGADFTQHNDDIAKAFKCDPSTVRYWRLHHDVPASTAPRRPGSGRPVKYNRNKFRPSRSASDNARDMGCSYQLAWWLLKQHKLKGTKK